MEIQLLAIVPLLSLLLIAHELGHFLTARRAGITVEEFGIFLPPRLFGIRRGGVLYSINAIPFGAFVKMQGEEDPTAPGSFARKSKLVRAAVLSAGSAMNFLVACVVFTIAFATGVPDVVDVTAARIISIAPDSPAQTAGLQVGDLVLVINGEKAVPLDNFRRVTSENLGKAVTLEIERNGKPLSITITPRVNPPEGQGAMGVGIQPHGTVGLRRFGVAESVLRGIEASLSVVITTLAIPILLAKDLIPAEAARPIGLPGMAQLASQAASVSLETGRWFPILSLTGFISAGLSLANMLPLPALDGGRLLFVVIEAIRGRRVSPQREAAVHFVGLLTLIALMILISLNDLVTPLPKVDWGVP